MVFTRGLGLRYLWVDALCLVQDAGEDVTKGVMVMDLIYERAYVTILAADGDSAESGLPGVRETPRKVRQSPASLKAGLKIMQIQSLDRHLNQSIWASRGWTFQEQYLSRRIIAFVSGLAFFRCRERVWSEETWTDRNPELHLSNDTRLNFVSLAQEEMDHYPGYGTAFEYLFASIGRFQLRHLSNEQDALNAMAGIMTRVAARARTDMVSGLPLYVFPLALCFNRRFTLLSRRSCFPSWSWAGWKGEPMWIVLDRLDHVEVPEDYDTALRQVVAFIKICNVHDAEDVFEVLWTPSYGQLERVWPGLEFPLEKTTPLPSKPSSTLSWPSNMELSTLRIPSIVVKGTRGDHVSSSTVTVLDLEQNPCGQMIPDITLDHKSDDHLSFLIVALAYKTHDFSQALEKPREDPPAAVWALLIVKRDNRPVYERRGVALLH